MSVDNSLLWESAKVFPVGPRDLAFFCGPIFPIEKQIAIAKTRLIPNLFARRHGLKYALLHTVNRLQFRHGLWLRCQNQPFRLPLEKQGFSASIPRQHRAPADRVWVIIVVQCHEHHGFNLASQSRTPEERVTAKVFVVLAALLWAADRTKHCDIAPGSDALQAVNHRPYDLHLVRVRNPEVQALNEPTLNARLPFNGRLQSLSGWMRLLL